MGKKNKFNDLVINIFIFVNVLLIIYVTYRDFIFHRGDASYQGYYFVYYIILFSSLILISIIKLYFSQKFKNIIIISSLSIIFSFYLFELLMFSNVLSQFNAPKKTENFDNRTKFEVLMDMKADKVVPSISPKWHLTYDSDLKPFSGLSDELTVWCNESGRWIIEKSDRFGFNNKDEIWNSDKIFSYILGDSFAEGACVNQENTISGNLSNKGYKSISLAAGGNGPLIMLGTLKEYTKLIKSKFIFWTFYEGNDLIDLENELNNNFFDFKKYYDENFTQNLILNKIKINQMLNDYYQNQLKIKLENKNLAKNNNDRLIRSVDNFDFIRFLKLYEIRAILGLSQYRVSNDTILNYLEILDIANKYSSKNDMKLIFVYLPRFAKNMKYANNYQKDEILKGVEELNIPIIDIDKLVFKNHEDPLSLFPFRKKNHYNERAHNLISEEIINFFK